MISTIGSKLSSFSERFVPDPFIFAIVLTGLTAVLGLGFGKNFADLSILESANKLGEGWYASFYGTGLMKFALQMCIVLITGHALAMTGAVRKAIELLTGIVSTPRAAVVVVALVACLASLIQWGLGAIAGAFMAREMGRAFARKGTPVHYPLLGAAGYAGFMVWHGGLSGSAPLKVAEPGHFLEGRVGVIPVTETLFGSLNITVTGTLLVLIPLVFWMLMPKDEADMRSYDGPLDDCEDAASEDASLLIRFLEHSPVLNIAMAIGILGFLVSFFVEKGAAGWNLDSINLLFLMLGLALHRSPVAYVNAVADGVRGCAGIILQFPFYFGILGLLKSSGLIEQFSQLFVEISTKDTYPLLTFISAAVVNFFVPSGGGQWAVQGPIMLQSVETMGISPTKVIMALAYGDAWTNMLQPFWALPLLGIMGLKARDIIGYTAFLMIVTGPVILLLLYVL